MRAATTAAAKAVVLSWRRNVRLAALRRQTRWRDGGLAQLGELACGVGPRRRRLERVRHVVRPATICHISPWRGPMNCSATMWVEHRDQRREVVARVHEHDGVHVKTEALQRERARTVPRTCRSRRVARRGRGFRDSIWCLRVRMSSTMRSSVSCGWPHSSACMNCGMIADDLAAARERAVQRAHRAATAAAVDDR